MNDERIIRKINGVGKQPRLYIPIELGFEINDYVEIVKLNENAFKVVKIDIIQKDTTKTDMEKVISDMKEIKGEIPIKEDNCLQGSYDDYDKPRFVQDSIKELNENYINNNYTDQLSK